MKKETKKDLWKIFNELKWAMEKEKNLETRLSMANKIYDVIESRKYSVTVEDYFHLKAFLLDAILRKI